MKSLIDIGHWQILSCNLVIAGAVVFHMAERKRFDGITADAFVTEADRRALKSLERVPLLPTVLRKFHDLGADRWFYCMNMANAVRCGPKQYHTLYGMFQESCAIMDMPEPELYVANNPFPNAFAGGVERPFITVRSSMIDTLTDDGLYHLIGHELGHIKSGHMLYHTVGRILVPLIQSLGRRLPILGDAAAIGLVFAFYEWMRQSEISCDRAGLIVSQDLNVSLGAMLNLAAGPNRMSHEMSLETFMEQARTYKESPGLDQLGKIFLYFTSTWAYTHPQPVHRAQSLEKWHEKGYYDRILRGHYEPAAV